MTVECIWIGPDNWMVKGVTVNSGDEVTLSDADYEHFSRRQYVEKIEVKPAHRWDAEE
jgi:hypothetical protein